MLPPSLPPSQPLLQQNLVKTHTKGTRWSVHIMRASVLSWPSDKMSQHSFIATKTVLKHTWTKFKAHGTSFYILNVTVVQTEEAQQSLK